MRFLIKRVILQGSTAVRFKTNTGWMCPRQSWLFMGLLKRVTWIRVNYGNCSHTHKFQNTFNLGCVWLLCDAFAYCGV